MKKGNIKICARCHEVVLGNHCEKCVTRLKNLGDPYKDPYFARAMEEREAKNRPMKDVTPNEKEKI